MKEILIAFLLALVIGAFLNGYRTQPETAKSDTLHEKDRQNQNAVNQPSVPGNNTGTVQPAADVPELDDLAFQHDVINSATPVLVYFQSENSEPCKRALPTVKAVANIVEDRFRVVSVNILDHPAIARSYDINMVPAFAVFRDGHKTATAFGELSQDSLLELLK